MKNFPEIDLVVIISVTIIFLFIIGGAISCSDIEHEKRIDYSESVHYSVIKVNQTIVEKYKNNPTNYVYLTDTLNVVWQNGLGIVFDDLRDGVNGPILASSVNSFSILKDSIIIAK